MFSQVKVANMKKRKRRNCRGNQWRERQGKIAGLCFQLHLLLLFLLLLPILPCNFLPALLHKVVAQVLAQYCLKLVLLNDNTLARTLSL